MAPEVTTKTSIVTVLGFLLAMVTATKVDITQEWKPDFGWEITCSWSLYANDSLQSVKLSKNKQQFMIFRPENQIGSLSKKQTWNLVENIMNVECLEDENNGVSGKCVCTVEPQQPPRRDFTFSCEVSGERPYFRMDEKEITVEALVPPSDAMMAVTRQESGPASLNCTATGLPAPTIEWTVDDQRVPHNFHGTPVWNATSKLWRVWSSFTPQTEDLDKVQCTPEVAKGNQLVKGQSALYNDARRNTRSLGAFIVIILTTLVR